MRLTFARAALLGTVAAAALVTTPAIAQENADTKPATPNTTAEGRAQNRRVEVVKQ